MSSVRAFQCPNCQQFINNLSNVCRFCSITLSDEVLSAAIGNEDFVNNAYNAASSLRISAGALATMFFLSFVPFIGFVAGWVHLILLVTIPFGLLYWLLRYGTTRLDNESFKEAKKYCWITLVIWLAFVVLRIVLLGLFIAMVSRR